MALVVLGITGIAIAAVMGFVFFVLKMVFWLLFLPFRLLFLPFYLITLPFRLLAKLLWIPFGLTFGLLGLGLGAVVLPLLMLVVGGVLIFGLIAAAFALIIPLIPFVLFALLLWALFRRPPVAV